jgi:hypothetical protein
MDTKQMLSIVEHYCQKIYFEDKHIKVTRVAEIGVCGTDW